MIFTHAIELSDIV